jgi:hypothetical protein
MLMGIKQKLELQVNSIVEGNYKVKNVDVVMVIVVQLMDKTV